MIIYAKTLDSPMWIPKGPLYMSTKYFLDQTKIANFKVKYTFWQNLMVQSDQCATR